MVKWADYKKQITVLDQEEIKELEIVAQIISRRKKLGITQSQLAEAAGLQQSAIARLEREGAVPRLDTLNKVSKALGLKLALVSDEENSATTELAIHC